MPHGQNLLVPLLTLNKHKLDLYQRLGGKITLQLEGSVRSYLKCLQPFPIPVPSSLCSRRGERTASLFGSGTSSLHTALITTFPLG